MKKYESAVQLVDTHCHLAHMINKTSMKPFSDDEQSLIRAIITRAASCDISYLIEISTTTIESFLAIQLAKIFKNVYPVIGIHPHEATDTRTNNAGIIFLKKLLNEDRATIVGIGECGLDKHYPDFNLRAQIDLFKAQIELALEYDKALVVHTRDAQDETYAILEQYKNELKRVTIHCYSNDLPFAQAVTQWGWFLGIGGTVTYPKNNALRQIVTTIGLEHIVLETDAPFLPPQSIRGKQNSPDQIAVIATYVASLTATSVENVASITTRNARTLFGFDLFF